MQLSPETISVLTNFSQINPNLMLTPGNTIRTIHPSKALFATAEIQETIEGEAAILELGRFLRTLSMVSNPSISFGEKQFTITDETGKTKINYTYADPTSMIKVPRGVAAFNAEAHIRLTSDTLKSIIVAGKSLKLPSVKFSGRVDGTCEVLLYDPKGKTRDNYVIDVTEYAENVTGDFGSTLNIEYINFVMRDYVVKVNDKAVEFDGGDIRYMVAVDTSNK